MIAARLKTFGAFWYDFVVGDDWRLALGVLVALAATSLLGHATALPVWWVLPAVLVVLLPWSLLRAVRRR